MTIKTNLKYRNKLLQLNIDEVIFIVIHHLDASKATAEDIHDWHLKRAFSGAGYNEYIRKDGNVYIMRGDKEGAHTKGYNNISYGIALEGNYNVELMPIPQLNSLIERLKYHKNRFKKLKSIVGHKDLNSTSCPGKNVDLKQILTEVYKEEATKEHWAEKPYRQLKNKGIIIHEKRFDDNITRGEVFALLSQMSRVEFK